MSNATNNEIISVDASISTTTTKPSFPYIAKFILNEYEEMRARLNEIVIATNLTYKYYPAEYKLTLP